jgi:oxygen-independent coproporphyrinogen-3 oxidase
VKDIGYLPDFSVPNIGLYVHIPFCRELCPFCPYYKTKPAAGDIDNFLKALLWEIQIVSEKIVGNGNKRQVTSLYFGGGSPAIMLDNLQSIRKKIDESFQIIGNSGIELHPSDVTEATAGKLHDLGFDMVSLGIQSFSSELLKNLGREDFDGKKPLKMLKRNGFKAIDVDLIFGIPGQKESDLRSDFLTAVDLGATQISTYPFIDFSYARNKKRPLDHAQKKRLLQLLLKTAEEMGFSRTSVWTFGRKNAPRYSSVTRDCFLGFGPSAASLGLDAFKVNTFSVNAYIETVSKGIIPTALRMSFKPRTRRLYWLFWNCYNSFLSESIYRQLFLTELKSDFGWSLEIGTKLGLFERLSDGWALSELGSYYFHRIEQLYTHQYIDKTWHSSMKTPWPERINLY